MKRRAVAAFAFGFLWGCARSAFLIADFESAYRPKVKTVALMPFSLPAESSLAEKHRLGLEEGIAMRIARSDSLHTFVFPEGVRARFWDAADASVFRLTADSLGKLFSAEALLFAKVIRLSETGGSNPTTRQVGASKYLRRGVELLAEFRLVEAASGKLLWKYRVRRFGEDVESAGQQVGQATAGVWPLHP